MTNWSVSQMGRKPGECSTGDVIQVLESVKKYAVVHCVKGRRSKSVRRETLPESSARRMSFAILRRSVSVLWCVCVGKLTEKDRWYCVQWNRQEAAVEQTSLWFLTWKRGLKQAGSFSNYLGQEKLSWGQVQLQLILKSMEKYVEWTCFYASVLQAVDGVVSLAFCPYLVYPALQHFRSSKMQATGSSSFAHPCVCWVSSLHCVQDRTSTGVFQGGCRTL